MIRYPDGLEFKVEIPRGRFILHPDPLRFADVALSLFNDAWWLIHPELINRHTIDNLHSGFLYEGRDGDGRPFILPVTDPCAYESEWHDSLYHGIDLARQRWVVVEEDLTHSRFNVRPSPQVFPAQVDWSNSFEETLAIAFTDHYIDTWEDIGVNLLGAPGFVPPKHREDRDERMRSLLKKFDEGRMRSAPGTAISSGAA